MSGGHSPAYKATNAETRAIVLHSMEATIVVYEETGEGVGEAHPTRLFIEEVNHVRKHRTRTISARAGTFGQNQSVAPGPRRCPS